MNKIKEILESRQMPGITGTRDSFGVMKAFKDHKTGKIIDNWKSWEKAGYRNPLETHKDSNVKAGIKRKIEKMRIDSGARKTI